MPKNRPHCHCGAHMKHNGTTTKGITRWRCTTCGVHMKRNGTTTKGITRWRCTTCGASSTKHRPDITNTAAFTAFIDHLATNIYEVDLCW